jgi:uncharacterized protein YcbK (DUF882 family)
MEGMPDKHGEIRARGPASPGSSAGRGGEATAADQPVEHPLLDHALDEAAELAAEVVHTLEDIFSPPVRSRRVWHGAGLRERAERWFEGVAWGVVMLMGAGWAWSIAHSRATGRDADGTAGQAARGVTATTAAVTAAFTEADRPTTAYLTDAAMRTIAELRGASGAVRLVQRAPGERLADDSLVITAEGAAVPAGRAVGRPVGVRVGATVRPADGLRVVTLTPLSARRNGRIGLYYIGTWPTEGGRAPSPAYAPPRGLIEVTRETQDTPVSEHLRLRDFLTHDQANVWPKYVVISPRNVDKVELVLADLEGRGVPARGVHVMSGFRTPQYNRAGGDARGRAGLSRHMFGDATDFWIDNDGDGRMDDLNHDGRHDIGDARTVCDAVDRVERAHPELVGGCGYYPATSAHGPFTHIDARGYRARWVGSGDGG